MKALSTFFDYSSKPPTNINNFFDEINDLAEFKEESRKRFLAYYVISKNKIDIGFREVTLTTTYTKKNIMGSPLNFTTYGFTFKKPNKSFLRLFGFGKKEKEMCVEDFSSVYHEYFGKTKAEAVKHLIQTKLHGEDIIKSNHVYDYLNEKYPELLIDLYETLEDNEVLVYPQHMKILKD